MVFHWSLSDSKSPQVSRTRLRILAVLSNAVVWIVSTRPPTSKSSRPFNNPLVIVPKAPITIGTIVTFMFHSFFNCLARLRYLSFFSLSSDLFCGPPGQQSRLFCKFSFFCCCCCCWLLWGLVFWPRLGDLCVCQSPIGVYVCHFLGQLLDCAYTICLNGRIEISRTFPSGPPCRLSRVSPCTPSVLICCICLLCDWSFRLCHRIAYIYFFVASLLLLLLLLLFHSLWVFQTNIKW